MKRLLYIFFAIFLGIGSSLLVSCQKEEIGLGSIYGMVTNSSTGAPVPNVRIELEKRSREDYKSIEDLEYDRDEGYYWGVIRSTVSHSDGSFEFTDLNSHISYHFYNNINILKKRTEIAQYRVTVSAEKYYAPYPNSDTKIVTVEAGRQSRVDFQLTRRSY